MRARDNPFRIDRVHSIRFRSRVWTWDTLMSVLERARYRGAIVGPEGSGKTTLLEELAARLEDRGHRVSRLTLRTEAPDLPTNWRQVLNTSPAPILLVDGAEQMPSSNFRRFLNEAASLSGLIITSHRPGLLPTLVECSTDVSLLDDLMAELLPSAVIASLGPLPHALFKRHHGNIRLVLRDLYDHYSSG